MAIIFANTGARPSRDANQQTQGATQLGASTSITTGAASASAQLPVDANGKLYPAYLITATAAAWYNINTAGDAAVAGAANTYLITPGAAPFLLGTPPTLAPGATAQVSAIQDTAAGKVCIIGVF